jgi:hypothetical protein
MPMLGGLAEAAAGGSSGVTGSSSSCYTRRAPALLDALKEVRRPDRPTVGDGRPQMRDAGLEVVGEAAQKAFDRVLRDLKPAPW